MKIAAELSYQIASEKWLRLQAVDPCVHPFVNALRMLSDQGHETVMFCASDVELTTIDNSTGVVFHFSPSSDSHANAIRMFDPDVLLVMSSPEDAHKKIQVSSLRAKKVIRIYGEASQHINDMALSVYTHASMVLPTFDYEVNILRENGVTCQVESVPLGVNTGWIRSLVQPKQYDICTSGWSRLKGFSLGMDVMKSLAINDIDVHPYATLNSMDRSDYIRELSKCRYLFLPSLTEGCARTITEALVCGVIPIVPTEATNVCQHIEGFHHHEIRTYGWCNAVEDRVCFGRDAESIAKETVQCMAKDDGIEVNHQIPPWMDSQHEAQEYVRLISLLT